MSHKDIPLKKRELLHSIMTRIARGSTPGERNAARHAAERVLKRYDWTLQEFIEIYYPNKRATPPTPVYDVTRPFDSWNINPDNPFQLWSKEGLILFSRFTKELSFYGITLIVEVGRRMSMWDKVFLIAFCLMLFGSCIGK